MSAIMKNNKTKPSYIDNQDFLLITKTLSDLFDEYFMNKIPLQIENEISKTNSNLDIEYNKFNANSDKKREKLNNVKKNIENIKKKNRKLDTYISKLKLELPTTHSSNSYEILKYKKKIDQLKKYKKKRKLNERELNVLHARVVKLKDEANDWNRVIQLLSKDYNKMNDKYKNIKRVKKIINEGGLNNVFDQIMETSFELYFSIKELSKWDTCLKTILPLLKKIYVIHNNLNELVDGIPGIFELTREHIQLESETYNNLNAIVSIHTKHYKTLYTIVKTNTNEFKKKYFVTLCTHFIDKIEKINLKFKLMLDTMRSNHDLIKLLRTNLNDIYTEILMHILHGSFIQSCLEIKSKNIGDVFEKYVGSRNPVLKLVGGGKSGANVYFIENKNFVFKTYSEKIVHKGKREISIACHLGFGQNRVEGSPVVYDFGRIQYCGKPLLYLLSEKVKGKELMKTDLILMKKTKGYKYLLAVMFKILYFLYSATKKLNGFLHNDLHPGNIFVNTNVEETKDYVIEGMKFKVSGPKITVIDFDLSSSNKLSENYAIRKGSPNFWLPIDVVNLLLKSTGYGNVFEIINKCRVYSEDLTIWNIYFLMMKIIKECNEGIVYVDGKMKLCNHSKIDKIIDSYTPCVSIFDCFYNAHFDMFRVSKRNKPKKDSKIDLVRKWNTVNLSEYVKENMFQDENNYFIKKFFPDVGTHSLKKIKTCIKKLHNYIKTFNDTYLEQNHKYPKQKDINYYLHLRLNTDFIPHINNVQVMEHLHNKKTIKINFPSQISLKYKNKILRISMKEGLSIGTSLPLKKIIKFGLDAFVGSWIFCNTWLTFIYKAIYDKILSIIMNNINLGTLTNNLGKLMSVHIDLTNNLINIKLEDSPILTIIHKILFSIIRAFLTKSYSLYPGEKMVERFVVWIIQKFAGISYSVTLPRFSDDEKATFILNKMLNGIYIPNTDKKMKGGEFNNNKIVLYTYLEEYKIKQILELLLKYFKYDQDKCRISFQTEIKKLKLQSLLENKRVFLEEMFTNQSERNNIQNHLNNWYGVSHQKKKRKFLNENKIVNFIQNSMRTMFCQFEQTDNTVNIQINIENNNDVSYLENIDSLTLMLPLLFKNYKLVKEGACIELKTQTYNYKNKVNIPLYTIIKELKKSFNIPFDANEFDNIPEDNFECK